MASGEIDAAVDNDIVLKAVSYELAAELWPALDRVGMLGAARYVLSTAIRRKGYPSETEKALLGALDALADSANTLEPSGEEVDFAADLEFAAQELNLELDSGESQLAAIVVLRTLPALETGDKRAIAALEVLLDREARLDPLVGKMRCLEQVIVRVLAEAGSEFNRLSQSICDRPGVDKTLSICFGCSSGGTAGEQDVVDGLSSYIEDLRSQAPRILMA